MVPGAGRTTRPATSVLTQADLLNPHTTKE